MTEEELLGHIKKLVREYVTYITISTPTTPTPIPTQTRSWTLDELKTVSAPFKELGQVCLVKEVLNFLKAPSISDLVDQDQYLLLVRDKALALSEPQRTTVINIIDKLRS